LFSASLFHESLDQQVLDFSDPGAFVWAQTFIFCDCMTLPGGISVKARVLFQ
jgi:hypothetical protein